MIEIMCLLTAVYIFSSVIYISRLSTPISAYLGGVIGISVFLGVPLFFIAITGELPVPLEFTLTSLPRIDSKSDVRFLIYVCLCAVVVVSLFAACAKVGLMTGGADNRLKRSTARLGYLPLLMYLSCSGLMFYYVSNSEEAHWYRSHEEFVASFGVWATLFMYTFAGSRFLLVGQIFLKLRSAGFTPKIMIAMGCFVAYDVFVVGNRIGTLVLVVSVMACMLEKRMYKVLAVGVVIAPIIGGLFAFFAFLRPYIHSAESIGELISLSVENVDATTTIGPLFLLGAVESVDANTLAAVFNDGLDSKLTYGTSYLRVLTFIVPRSMWPEKTETVTVQVGNRYADGHASLNSLFIGESIMAFGLIGPFFGVLILFGLIKFIQMAFPDPGIRSCMSLIASFMWVRMAFSDVALFMMAASVMCWGLSLVGRISVKKSLGMYRNRQLLHGSFNEASA